MGDLIQFYSSIVVTTVVAGDVVCGKCFVKFKEDITEDIDSYFSNKPNHFYFIEVSHILIRYYTIIKYICICIGLLC